MSAVQSPEGVLLLADGNKQMSLCHRWSSAHVNSNNGGSILDRGFLGLIIKGYNRHKSIGLYSQNRAGELIQNLFSRISNKKS